MFSLQSMFGKKDRFLDLLQASAQEAHESVRLVIELMKSPRDTKNFDSLLIARRKEKKIAEQIGNELVKTFITGLEREDIESLGRALFRIPKSAEKLAERFLLAAPQVPDADFSRQVDMMSKATDAVLLMVRQLKNIDDLETMKELNDRLQIIETEADRFMNELIRDLYSGKYDAIRAMILRDLYELIEKVVDRCHDTGNIVMHIVLKNS